MSVQLEAGERHDRTIRAWLLALLRFAVTRDNDDRLAVLAAASEINKLSLSAPQGQRGFRFFHRTSAELCAAITDPRRPSSEAVLRRHLERMTDERMRRAFAAALELDHASVPVQRTAGPHSRSGLWKGLAAARPGAERL